MQVLKLLHQHNYQIRFKIGNELGVGGADGQVFELMDNQDRVIKLSVLYDYFRSDIEASYLRINDVLTYIQNSNLSFCARVYEHERLYSGQRYTHNGMQDFITYYYVMENLSKITEDEKKVFYSLLSHEDRNVKKNYSLSSAIDMLKEMQRGLDFDYNKAFRFYRVLKESKFHHMDLHPRNIMKDTDGNFKLIDFDRVMIGD